LFLWIRCLCFLILPELSLASSFNSEDSSEVSARVIKCWGSSSGKPMPSAMSCPSYCTCLSNGEYCKGL
jgi:hypothetical protein